MEVNSTKKSQVSRLGGDVSVSINILEKDSGNLLLHCWQKSYMELCNKPKEKEKERKSNIFFPFLKI